MNTDPTRPGASGPDDEPVLIGAGLRPVEDRLRRALDADARTIAPTDRLGVILADAHAADPRAGLPGARHHRWLVPSVAAAAVVLVAGTVWAVNRPPVLTPPVAATSTAVETSTSALTSSTPSNGPSSLPTRTATQPTTPPPTPPPTSGIPPVTTVATVPVYYLGPVVAGSGQLRLFREFVPATVAAPATPETRALAALRLAMGQPPAGSGYRSAWTGVTAQSVSLGSDAITVTLSAGSTDAAAGLAAEQLGWTVQAALGSALPVRFVLADGGAEVAPGHPVTTAFTRPTDPLVVLEHVAPIWVDEPARGATVKAGSPLTVKGVASTFEATVEWELVRGGRRIDHGVTTASEAAPARGTYTFRTRKPLTAGDYVLRVFESSAQDGSTVAEQRVPLTAR